MSNLKWGNFMKNIIKYLGIALVIVGILLVMKNLFTKDSNWSSDKEYKNNTKYYSATIKLLDKDTKNYLSGSKLVLKDSNNELVAEWTTEEKVYIVNKLVSGKYTLIQSSAPENYHLNENNIVFEIKNKDRDIVMYNTKMTEEEIKDANTTKEEVGVDNTLSKRNILTSIIAVIISIIGLNLIYKVRKSY